MRARLCCALLMMARSTYAQTTSTPPRTLQDNSFLVEEAYNQEPGVVQHVATYSRDRAGAFSFTFTQEWPVPAERHQLSVSASLDRILEPERRTGLGDLAVSYRFQWIGGSEARVAAAPGFSLVLPTGSADKGFGSGGVGLEVSFPVSVALGRHFACHSNAGATLTPSASNPRGETARTTGYTLGQSLIWLASPTVHVMLEAAWTRDQDVAGPGRTGTEQSFFLSPGVRYAVNFPGGLQVVPGVAVPIGLGPSRGQRAVFLYLSFEHAFREGR